MLDLSNLDNLHFDLGKKNDTLFSELHEIYATIFRVMLSKVYWVLLLLLSAKRLY